MRKTRAKLVTISTLALSAACSGTAGAVVKVTCSRNFFLGKHYVCGTGSLVINPDSSTVPGGCIVSGTGTPPQPARCKVYDGGGSPPTANVVVNFTRTSINVQFGGSSAKVDSFLMQHSGTVTAKTQFTFTPTEVKNTVFLDVGGTFHFTNGLALGTYTGTVKISAN